MSDLCRFGVSLEKDLLDTFDKLISGRSYTNRSEAIRDLIRKDLITEEWQSGTEVAGAITLIYDHHHRDLMNRVTDIQHDHGSAIISTQHVHLDHHNCLEIIAVKGSPAKVQELKDRLGAIKGVKHVTLGMSSTGKRIT